jgi:transaldolase
MIKVPATRPGLPAIRRLIAAGVNVNVTLIFSVDRYREVAEAFLAGLEDRVKADLPVTRLDSVASFFLSRIDVLIDPQLEKLAEAGGEQAGLAASLVGEVAIASARQAYQLYQEIFAGPRWEELRKLGAQPQRLLWASTGNKNPKYDDLKYIEALIGPNTVNTIPVETLNLYRAKGQPAARLSEGADKQVLARLPELGLNLTALTTLLDEEGA